MAGKRRHLAMLAPQIHDGLAYRRDIDGLRAVAVGLVVVYHAGFSVFPGGFIGVDVFFVISGYLITKVIAQDLSQNRFSFREFYRRRIKRLLPAYLALVTATLLAGMCLSLPTHLDDSAQGIAASSVYASNLWFWRESGYFASTSDIKPFLHTWSLGVEEQFYLIFPLLLWLAWGRISRRAAVVLFCLVFTASLALSELQLAHDAAASFYLLPSRAWELMLGGGLSLLGAKAAGVGRSVAVVAGLIAIFASGCLLHAGPSFPGLTAIPVCIGTAILLWAGGGDEPISRVLLENRIAVFLGRISYSLYLWHWPLFAFYRYRYFDSPPSSAIALLLIAMAILLATLSYHLIELPFRRRDRLPGWRSIILASSSTIVIVAVCATINILHGLPGRFPSTMRVWFARPAFKPDAKYCTAISKNGSGLSCRVGDQDISPDVALWGDSHAGAVASALGEAFRKDGRGLQVYTHVGCPPALGVERDVRPAPGDDCLSFSDDVLRRLLADTKIRTVIFVSRWSFYDQGDFGDHPDDGFVPFARPQAGLPSVPFEQAYRARIAFTAAQLHSAGKQIVILLPVPEMLHDVPDFLPILYLRDADLDSFALPLNDYYERQGRIRAFLIDLASKVGGKTVDPISFLCRDRCYYRRGSKLLYADDDHLSPDGAALIAPAIVRASDGGN